MQATDRHFPIHTYNWWIEYVYILIFSILTDASLLALTAQAAQEAEGAHTFTPSWTIPCRNTPLPTVPGPRKCTVRSAHTGQANWTFGVQPALAWYKLHSVSAPSQINCMHNYSCDATQPIKSVLLSIVIWVRYRYTPRQESWWGTKVGENRQRKQNSNQEWTLLCSFFPQAVQNQCDSYLRAWWLLKAVFALAC